MGAEQEAEGQGEVLAERVAGSSGVRASTKLDLGLREPLQHPVLDQLEVATP